MPARGSVNGSIGSRVGLSKTGADGRAMTPSGIWGVVNDAVAVHFADVTIASAFVARWCRAHRVEIVDGLYRVREDEPVARTEPR